MIDKRVGPIGVIIRDPKSQLFQALKQALAKGERVLLRHRWPMSAKDRQVSALRRNRL